MAYRASRGASTVFRWSESRSSVSCFEIQSRHFTSSRTSQKSKSVPTFGKASSPELQTLLSTIRTNLFLPAYLSKEHRKLVYSLKAKRSIEDDPVDVEISGEKFRLRYLDRTKDLPKGPLPRRALKLMRTRKDWNNLPPLLEGLNTINEAKDSTPRTGLLRDIFSIIRKSGKANRQDVLLDCARRVSETGFDLKDYKVVREIMWWIQYKALSHDWKPKQLGRAFGIAQGVANLLDDEKHSSGNRISGPTDPRVRPEVIGVLLELAAAQAKISGSKEDRLSVEVYARRLLAVMANGFETDDYSDPSEAEVQIASRTLRFCSTLLYAMREASAVLGSASEEGQLLKEKSDSVAKQVKEAADLVMQQTGDAKNLGKWTYEKLFPSGI